MKFVTLAAFTAILGYAAFEHAGVDPGVWRACLIATGIAAALHFLLTRGRDVPPLDRVSAVAAGCVLGVAVLQIVPLPVEAIRVLSPARYELLRAAAPFTGGIPARAPLSAAPLNTLEYVLTLGAYVAVFLAVRNIAHETRERPWLAVWPLVGIAALEGVLGIVQAYGGSQVAHATGTYDSYDHYAGLLEMALPFAVMAPVAVLQRDRRRHESPAGPAIRACLVLAVAAVLLTGIIHSLSRMGFLVALAVLFVCGSMGLSFRGVRVDYEARGAALRRWGPSVLVGAVILLGFIYLPTDPLIARFSEFAKTDDISADTRAQIWRDSAGLVRSYAWTGCGLGAYESCFYRFKTVAPLNTVDYAHNDYLQVLAEMGVFGFAAGLVFVLRVLQRSMRGAAYARSADDRAISIAVVASVTGILLHSFVDFNMYVPANGFAFAWVLGVAGVNLRKRPATRRSSGRENGRESRPSRPEPGTTAPSG